MQVDVRSLKMNEKLMSLVGKYWQDLWEGHRAGKLVAWCSGFSPHEILKAMDISPVYLEGYGGFCSVAGVSTDLCNRAEALGYSPDLCSLIRNFIGATRGTPLPDPAMLPFGGLPKPDLIVCMPYCPGIYKIWEEYSRYFDVPLLVIERPYWHDSLSKEEINHHVGFLGFSNHYWYWGRIYLPKHTIIWWDTLLNQTFGLKGKAKELHAVGDCVSPRRALEAIYDGYNLGRVI